MKTQAESLLEYPSPDLGGRIRELAPSSSSTDGSPEPFSRFQRQAEEMRQQRRIMSRRHAQSIPEHRVRELERERQSLLDRKFEKKISRKEENRLAYVRWQLDTIDDARFGDDLDRLEYLVETHRSLIEDIKDLNKKLDRQIERSQ